MLIQLPGGPNDPSGSQNEESCNTFEAGLRRDLATAPVVSYDSVLGGAPKRGVDFALALISAPLWLPLMVIAAAWSKLRHRAPVFEVHDRIGYGGRTFKCFKLRIARPSATVEPLHDAEVANDLHAIADQADTRRAKWRRAFERLPQMFNVLKGEMALVGPSPLSRVELEPLKTARRYYLSARPGVVGVETLAEPGEDPTAQYKIYAMSWSLLTDVLIMWEALGSMRNRGELWRPERKASPAADVIVRQRSAG